MLKLPIFLLSTYILSYFLNKQKGKLFSNYMEKDNKSLNLLTIMIIDMFVPLPKQN
jgi:hypothetical protein